jgi:hypothetical protein
MLGGGRRCHLTKRQGGLVSRRLGRCLGGLDARGDGVAVLVDLLLLLLDTPLAAP